MNLDGRRLVHAQDLIIMEVALLDAPILEGDLAIERRRDAEHDRALDLRLDGVGIDRNAAIDRADDPVDANRSVPRHLDFGNLRHVGRKNELEGDAAPKTLRQWLSPAGLFGGKLEDGLGTGRLVKQSPPIGDRILLRRGRQLVHEAFGHEDVVRRSDAAPESRRNAWRFHLHILDVHVREGIDQIDRALGGVGVETIVKEGRCPSRDDRGASEAMIPGDRHPIRIEASGYPVEPIRPVHVVLDVFLAGPDDFDRAVDMLGDFDRARDAIDLQAPTESTPDQMIVHDDFVQRQARDLCGSRLGARDDLVADPDFAAVPADMNRAVHRLSQLAVLSTPAFWRSVGPSHNVFVTESFIDELAASAKEDAVAYRRALLDKSPRARAVLDLAAEKAGWGRTLPKGNGFGVSLQFVFGSYMALVAEVEVSKAGTVRVRRVVCAADIGTVVNPDTVQAQIQGGITFGATAALYGEITLKNGRVQQSNFDTYQMLRIDDAPAIEVHVVKSSEPPGGMGETGTSAIVPAIANAVFAATGRRLRKMPVDANLLKQA